MNVMIQGSGVAALCCARLLEDAGHEVRLIGAERARLPVIMLSERALKLLRDLFGDPNLLRDRFAIKRRTVAWGCDSSPATLDHLAVVVSEQALVESLQSKVSLAESQPNGSDWAIISARPLPDGASEHAIGSRRAYAAPIDLAPGVSSGECAIESVDTGWLFLVPDTPNSGWLLSVGDAPESLLSSSRMVARKIGQVTGPAREFIASPRITTPVCGQDWLACGSAAVAFDPICGDGTAYAAREAILASAVLRASENEPDREGLLAHYNDRVNGGFMRHLVLCRDLYRSGNNTPWWQEQVQALEHGLRWCNQRLSFERDVRFQLNGFDLARVSAK